MVVSTVDFLAGGGVEADAAGGRGHQIGQTAAVGFFQQQVVLG